MQVRARLDVHGARVGARTRELGQVELGPLDHQVHVHGAAAVVDLVGDRGHDLGPEGDDRHEMAIHHVDVEGARAGIEHLDVWLRKAPKSDARIDGCTCVSSTQGAGMTRV